MWMKAEPAPEGRLGVVPEVVEPLPRYATSRSSFGRVIM